jgi:hypothetical protein
MPIPAVAWSLHDAVLQLARERSLRSFKVECKQGPEGETVIAIVLDPPEPHARGAPPPGRVLDPPGPRGASPSGRKTGLR